MSLKRCVFYFYAICLLFASTGCQTTQSSQLSYKPTNIATTDIEAQWIRDGAPIEYEDQLWYPVDGIEGFTDDEMFWLGEYKGIPFFADKVDVRPFDRLYTKFGKNKFRYYRVKK